MPILPGAPMLEMCLLAQFTIWLIVCAAFVRSKSSSIFHPLFFYLVFHGLVFVIRPILGELLNLHQVSDYMSFYPEAGEKIRALAVSSIGLIVFAFAVLRAGREVPHFSRFPEKSRQSETTALWLTWLVLAPVAIYSALFALQGSSFDGTGRVQMERIEGVAVYTNTTGYLVDASQMLLPLVLLPIVFGRRKWVAFIPAALFLSYRVFLGWGRWTIVDLLIVIFLAQLWLRGHKWPRKKSVAAALVIIPTVFILFAALGDNRDLARDLISERRAELTILDDRTWLEKLDNLDFANFDYLTLVVSVVPKSTLTYTYGTQYLQIFTEPIPRMLWTSKPYGPPIKLFDLNDYANFIGLTVSLPGDGWMSGGWIGVVLTMALAGYILGRLHRWFWRNQQSKARVLLYLIIVTVSTQLFRDGGISIFKFMLFTSIPIVFWALAVQAVDRVRTRFAPIPRFARNPEPESGLSGRPTGFL